MLMSQSREVSGICIPYSVSRGSRFCPLLTPFLLEVLQTRLGRCLKCSCDVVAVMTPVDIALSQRVEGVGVSI